MTPKTAKAKADRIFSRAVRSRGECQRCGRRPPEVKLETSHIFSRRYANTRTLETNALCLCSACHRWWHDHPTETAELVVSVLGEDGYAALREVALSTKGQKFDWIAELERLETQYGKL